jgi:hypothetical protein
VFAPEIVTMASMNCKIIYARKFLPVAVPAAALQLLQVNFQLNVNLIWFIFHV